MFILDQIPTVAEAQANLDALTQEYASLIAEQKALSKRLKIVEERITALERPYRPESGEIGRAKSVLAQAHAAEIWDAAPVAMVKTRWDGMKERRISRLTAKQIHLYITRGSDHTTAFSRETGKNKGDDQIQDLDRVLALAKG